MPIANRPHAELLGAAWLVLGGCGSAVLAGGFSQRGIGFTGVALAFGLTLFTMVTAPALFVGGAAMSQLTGCCAARTDAAISSL